MKLFLPFQLTFPHRRDRKSTRLNSSHSQISYAVFCLKKKKHTHTNITLVKINETKQVYRTIDYNQILQLASNSTQSTPTQRLCVLQHILLRRSKIPT